ncbi:response regulator transcription factor [Actinoplanes sp. NPDC051346]|uniref:response regulator transcription factor n=1 Tax=Actinoplanes sp. NPDC051346 TaxID=3155048 RepID=UPI003428663A
MTPLTGVRVAVLENSPWARRDLVNLLTGAGAEVVAEAGSNDEFDAVYPAAGADVVVADVHLGERYKRENVDGLKVVSRLRADNERVGILMVTNFDRVSYMLRLMRIGTTGIGYLLKDNATDQRLLDAVAKVRDGKNYFDDAVFDEIATLQNRMHPAEALTRQETRVLRYVAELSLPTRAIADLMHLSEKTVDRHLNSIYQKFDIDKSKENCRVAAALRYVRDLQSYYFTQDEVP